MCLVQSETPILALLIVQSETPILALLNLTACSRPREKYGKAWLICQIIGNWRLSESHLTPTIYLFLSIYHHILNLSHEPINPDMESVLAIDRDLPLPIVRANEPEHRATEKNRPHQSKPPGVAVPGFKLLQESPYPCEAVRMGRCSERLMEK